MQQNKIPSTGITEPGLLAALGTPQAVCVYCGSPADMVCDDCDERNERSNQELEDKKRSSLTSQRKGWFDEKISRIDETYLTTDLLLLPRWSKEILDRWDPDDRYGVTLCGDSETYKTRTAVMLLQKAFLGGQVIEYQQAGDLRRKMNALARDGKDSRFLHELGSYPILAIDDLGNQAWTDASEEFFLSLFERRQSKKSIITTQYPAEEFIAKLNNRRAAIAIGRRIGREYNWTVDTNKGQITPPQPIKKATI